MPNEGKWTMVLAGVLMILGGIFAPVAMSSPAPGAFGISHSPLFWIVSGVILAVGSVFALVLEPTSNRPKR